MSELTAERARELFSYDPVTGELRNRVGRGLRARAAAVAESFRPDGRLSISVDYRRYLVHRLIWLIVHGEWPPADVDHIDNLRNDNRISNLRLATRSENNQNAKLHRSNSSGFHGVSQDKRRGKWSAQVQANGRRMRRGGFDTPEAAHAFYLAAKAELHPFQPTPQPNRIEVRDPVTAKLIIDAINAAAKKKVMTGGSNGDQPGVRLRKAKR